MCCRRPVRQPSFAAPGQCGRRNTNGITGRIKNPVYVDGDSEFGEYPWQVAILKKDPKESVYVCGGTLIDNAHILTAAHCVKTYVFVILWQFSCKLFGIKPTKIDFFRTDIRAMIFVCVSVNGM